MRRSSAQPIDTSASHAFFGSSGPCRYVPMAAHAAGLTDVILPERNRGDLDDVPADVREQMAFHPVMTIDEVLSLALEPAAVDLPQAA